MYKECLLTRTRGRCTLSRRWARRCRRCRRRPGCAGYWGADNRRDRCGRMTHWLAVPRAAPWDLLRKGVPVMNSSQMSIKYSRSSTPPVCPGAIISRASVSNAVVIACPTHGGYRGYWFTALTTAQLAPLLAVRRWCCARLSRMKALVGRARLLATNTPATPQSAVEPPSSPAISPFVITTAAGIARCAQPAPDATAGAGVERGDVAGGARARSLFSTPTVPVEKTDHSKAATPLCDDGLPKVGRLL